MARRLTRPDPIFVVGVPRSGTTLLASMLASHPRMGCGPETSFFNELTRVEPRRLLNRRTWPMAAVHFLSSIKLGGEPVPSRYCLSQEDMLRFLENRRPSVCAMLEVLTEQYIERVGKIRWVEKSPSHVLRGPEIRNQYPNAPIIRIVRDPRDVALSLEKVPWGVKSFVEGLLYWREFDEGGNAFMERDSKTLTMRYEDLLKEPVTVLTRICKFINERYEETMLDTTEASFHVRRGNEIWKNRVGQALDPSRAAAWRSSLSGSEIRLADAIVGDRLRHYGYPIESSDVSDMDYIKFYPLRRGPAQYDELLTRFVEQGGRFWPEHRSEQPAFRIYLGNPGHSAWLGHQSAERLGRMCRLTADVIHSRLRNRHIAWMRRPDRQVPIGRCGYLIKRLLESTPAEESLGMSRNVCVNEGAIADHDAC